MTSRASGVLTRGGDLLGLDLAGLELGEEAVDDAVLADLVLQRLADDLAREGRRQRADLLAQLDDRLLALGLDLTLGRLGDAGGLGLGLTAQLGDDRGALLARGLPDLVGLGARAGELGVVLLQRGLGLGLGLLGLAIPPSMAAARSSYIASIFGTTFEEKIQYRMPKATRPTMSSAGCGRRGRASGQPTPSAAFTDARTTSLPYLSIERRG